MADFHPAPTATDVRDRFDEVRRAGNGFIPASARFFLRHGKQAERFGNNAWMLAGDVSTPQLHQNPHFFLGRKWTRREAYSALTDTLSAYKQ